MVETRKTEFSLPGRFLTSEVLAGDPIQVGGSRIIPFARITRVAPKGAFRGLFWQRPASVLLIGADGRETVTPVYDLTRRIQWLLLAAGLIAALLIKLAGRTSQ